MPSRASFSPRFYDLLFCGCLLCNYWVSRFSLFFFFFYYIVSFLSKPLFRFNWNGWRAIHMPRKDKSAPNRMRLFFAQDSFFLLSGWLFGHRDHWFFHFFFVCRCSICLFFRNQRKKRMTRMRDRSLGLFFYFWRFLGRLWFFPPMRAGRNFLVVGDFLVFANAVTPRAIAQPTKGACLHFFCATLFSARLDDGEKNTTAAFLQWSL
nr:hypothetical protein [Pandoravirus aubagnensis]